MAQAQGDVDEIYIHLPKGGAREIKLVDMTAECGRRAVHALYIHFDAGKYGGWYATGFTFGPFCPECFRLPPSQA